MKKSILAIAAALALVSASFIGGCTTMRGVPSEDGTINLGPNALGDDPVGHRTYASFGEFAYATHQLKDLEADGLSKEQQLCFVDSLLDNIPNDLANRLNAFARNEVTLMESQYTDMIKEFETVAKNQTVAKSTYQQFKTKCA